MLVQAAQSKQPEREYDCIVSIFMQHSRALTVCVCLYIHVYVYIYISYGICVTDTVLSAKPGAFLLNHGTRDTARRGG